MFECEDADAIIADPGAVIIGKDFQLDPGATISGTVFMSDGTTPVTGESIAVSIVWDGSCGNDIDIHTYTNSADGTYTINALRPDTYYLKTINQTSLNLLDEWSTDNTSVIDCSGAQGIILTASETVGGRDFWLDTGATISGTIYDSIGTTPITGISLEVEIYKDSCWGEYLTSVMADTLDGSYTLEGLYPGEYCLAVNTHGANYIREWWATPESVQWPNDAELIAVNSGDVIDPVNFQLDTGATISGIVYQSDGTTAIVGHSMIIRAINQNACGGEEDSGGEIWINTADGTYTLAGLPPGSYYIKANDYGNAPYDERWWATTGSVVECWNAELVTVSTQQTVIGINFQLETDTDYDNMADDWEITWFGNLFENGGGDAGQ